MVLDIFLNGYYFGVKLLYYYNISKLSISILIWTTSLPILHYIVSNCSTLHFTLYTFRKMTHTYKRVVMICENDNLNSFKKGIEYLNDMDTMNGFKNGSGFLNMQLPICDHISGICIFWFIISYFSMVSIYGHIIIYKTHKSILIFFFQIGIYMP